MPSFNIHTPVRTPFAPAPSISPDLVAARQRLTDVRTAIETEKAPTEPPNQDLMNAIRQMSGKMALKEDVEVAKLETVKIFREELEPVKAHVALIDANAIKALDETKALNDRLVVAEQDSVKNFDRVGRLESELEKIKASLASASSSRGPARGNDDAEVRRSIAFKGFTSDESANSRVGLLDAFMAEHFAGVKYACVSHETTGPFQNKKLTDTSYVLLFDQFSADSALKKIKEDKGKYTCVSTKGKALKIGKRKTRLEKRRDYGLIRAEEILTEHVIPMKPKPAVKIVWEARKVTVGTTDAFKQEKSDERGSFCGSFAAVAFTDRKK